ncbi:MAG TPA: filamentous hemagglutinin N-terminal domain-containing protein [Burkholderiales bacterium]|nr:filamentous hemagglutinin N-terminal domain-containing protein [Burkholderiales bacterium]
MRFARSRISQALAAALGVGVPSVQAQVPPGPPIVLDGTMGGLPRAVPLTGAEYRINAADGQLRGTNLFHSFGRFNVPEDTRATFAAPSDISININNIISRVTGVDPSRIMGGIRSEISGANLFLLNPNGIVFGPKAVLDVSGSFYASTAHHLLLGTSGRFDAVNPGATVLTSAPPSAFGFIAPPAGVVVNGSELTGAPGKTLGFVTGPMMIAGANIQVPGGLLSLTSVGGPGEVALVRTEPVPAAGVTRAAITVSDSVLGATSTPASSGATVVIRGGRLTLTNTIAGVQNDHAGDAPGVIVDAAESLSMQTALVGNISTGSGSGGPVVVTSPEITLQDALISSISAGPGAAGAVSVSGNRISLSGQSGISSTVSASGASGGVQVNAAESLTVFGSAAARSQITSASEGTGAAGAVRIAAPTVLLDGGVVSSAVSGPGAAGPITIEANQVALTNGARIDSSSTGTGAAGAIAVFAHESIKVTGDENVASAIGSVATGGGAGGSIVLTAPLVDLLGANVSVSSSGAGAAGSIAVIANDFKSSFSLIDTSGSGTGPGGNIDVVADRVVVRDNSVLNSAAVEGAPGAIRLTGLESIAILRGDGNPNLEAGLFSLSAGPQNGSIISLSAPTVTIDQMSIRSSTFGSGRAGDIRIEGGTLSLLNGSQIDSRTRASGAAGNLTLSATDSITIGGRNSAGVMGGVSTSSTASGAGGNVVMNAPRITIGDAGVVADGQSTGAPGTITLTGESISLTDGARVSSSSHAPGAGGAVTITASRSFVISGENADNRSGIEGLNFGPGGGATIAISAPDVTINSGGIDTTASGAGAAGSVSIDGARIAFVNGGAMSSTSTGAGRAGDVRITATESLAMSGQQQNGFPALIVARSVGTGDGGTISLNAPSVTLDGAVISVSSESSGSAGNIAVNAGRLALLNGALLDSSTSGTGTGGTIDIAATESVSLTGKNSIRPSTINSATSGSGAAGQVSIAAPLLTLSGGAISADTEGSGAGGNIRVIAGRLEIAERGQIFSNTSGTGAGGRIIVDAGESVSIVTPSDAPFLTGIFALALGAGPGGDIEITSPAVSVDGGSIAASTITSAPAGSLAIRGARFSVTGGAFVDSSGIGPGDAGRVLVDMSESISVSGSNAAGQASSISSSAFRGGRGGEVFLSAPLITLNDKGFVGVDAQGGGNAGQITVRAGRVVLTGGGEMSSSASDDSVGGRIDITALESLTIAGAGATFNNSGLLATTSGRGGGGEIVVRAPLVDLTGGTISSATAGGGNAGRVTVDAGRVDLRRGAVIDSSTFGAGAGGHVSVTATEAINVSGSSAAGVVSTISSFSTGAGAGGDLSLSAPTISVDGGSLLANTSATGAAGRINIDAGRLDVTRGGLIDSSTFAAGAGGQVNVTATDAITVSGTSASGGTSTISSLSAGTGSGGDLSLSAATISVDAGSLLVNATAAGDAGRMLVSGGRVTISNGGVLASGTAGSGRGGTMRVTATESILVTGEAGGSRSRMTNSSNGTGDAGEIFVIAPDITLQDRGFIRGIASDRGRAGNVTVRASTLALNSGGEISTSTTGFGRGGNIDIRATGRTDMTDSSIRSTSSAAGEAGNIALDAGGSLIMLRSAITTEANRADGGNIFIKANDILRMTDSEITTSVGSGFGNGGNITIDPIFVVLDSSRIIANAFGGNGGNIDISTDALLKSGDSTISASSQLGVQGTIRISAPDSDLAGSLTPLASGLIDPSQLLRQSCSARAASGGNSFVGVGHGGLPEQPGSLAFSSYAPTRAIAADERAPVYALLSEFSCAR